MKAENKGKVSVNRISDNRGTGEGDDLKLFFLIRLSFFILSISYIFFSFII